MNEALVAASEAPVVRKDRLFIVLMADINSPFFGLLFSKKRQAVSVHCLKNGKPKEGIKSSGLWWESRDELVCRHRGEGVLIEKLRMSK